MLGEPERAEADPSCGDNFVLLLPPMTQSDFEQRPQGAPEARPVAYTWEQFKPILQIQEKLNMAMEIIPGTTVTGMPDLAACDVVDARLGESARLGALPITSPARQWRASSPTVLSHTMLNVKDKQHIRQTLRGLRMVILEPNLDDAEQIKGRLPESPVVTAIFLADSFSTGRKVVEGAIAVRRTFVARDHPRVPADRRAQGIDYVAIGVHTEVIRSREWERMLEASKASGHILVAAAMEHAAPAGLPELGRRR